MRRVSLDIETFGTAVGSVVVSVGACAFDDDAIKEELYRALDVTDQLLLGLGTDAATLAWWGAQSAESRAALRPQVRLGDGLDQVAAFVRDADEVWVRGLDFDLPILSEVFRRAGRPEPWPKRGRDVRTLLGLFPESVVALPPDGTKHHALFDARRQALQVQAALRYLRHAGASPDLHHDPTSGTARFSEPDHAAEAAR